MRGEEARKQRASAKGWIIAGAVFIIALNIVRILLAALDYF